ncbi:hypothetical protein N657DRAFT_440379 [Parathielavia appendiculata]|uniref:Secreted protein n=1 Tax=Parathielavia appendiculata TaxID=2587402 RepID=A0AAN6U0Q0_9PEZI|nr:hypothetical protein N657DRAFT_440379 [Parathielavia appendiculata]
MLWRSRACRCRRSAAQVIMWLPTSAVVDASLASVAFGAGRAIQDMHGAARWHGPCCCDGAEQSPREAGKISHGLQAGQQRDENKRCVRFITRLGSVG